MGASVLAARPEHLTAPVADNSDTPVPRQRWYCRFPPTHRLIASSRSKMHPCLNVDEILSLFARELVASEAKATAAALARCCRSFEEPVLDALWEAQERLTPLLKCIPRDVWEEEDGEFVSLPTVFIFLELNRTI